MNRPLEIIKIYYIFYLNPMHWKTSLKDIVNRGLWFLGSIWLIISLIDFFFKQSNPLPKNPDIFWIVCFGSLLLAILTTTPPIKFTERIQGKDVTITILIGDIFSQFGDMVLSTNSTFDTTLTEDFISPNSIQGQLTLREYDKIEHLDQEISDKLKGIDCIYTHSRSCSKNDQYEIGTIIKLNHRSNFRSYWVAMADVNESGKPTGKFENLQICLEGLWRYIGTNGHMTRLNIPILGSGKTGINENRFTILQEIIFFSLPILKNKKLLKNLLSVFTRRI